jgi:hypothetical protein
MKKLEERLGARLVRARKGGLSGIYLWSPSASEVVAFGAASEVGDWDEEGRRMRSSSLQMLEESLTEETGVSFLKLVVGVDEMGAVLAFALLDDDSDDHGRELITLAALEGNGFGSALLAAAGAKAGAELVLYSDPGVEGYYDKMGMEGADGWRRWGEERCASLGAMLEAAGLVVYEHSPAWPELVVALA